MLHVQKHIDSDAPLSVASRPCSRMGARKRHAARPLTAMRCGRTIRPQEPARSRTSNYRGFYAMDWRQRALDTFERIAAIAAAPELAGGRAEPDRRAPTVVEVEGVA